MPASTTTPANTIAHRLAPRAEVGFRNHDGHDWDQGRCGDKVIAVEDLGLEKHGRQEVEEAQRHQQGLLVSEARRTPVVSAPQEQRLHAQQCEADGRIDRPVRVHRGFDAEQDRH